MTVPGFELTSQRQKVSRLPTEPAPGRPALTSNCLVRLFLSGTKTRETSYYHDYYHHYYIPYYGLGGANPAVNTPRPSRGTRIESCDFIVLIGDP